MPKVLDALMPIFLGSMSIPGYIPCAPYQERVYSADSVKARGDEKIAMGKPGCVAFFSAPVYDNVKFYICAMERGVAFSYMTYYSRQ